MKTIAFLGVAVVSAAWANLYGESERNAWTFISPAPAATNAPAVAASFAKCVTNADEVIRAEAVVTALGSFEFFVNGRLVSTTEGENRADFLRPGCTDRKKRRTALGYDVTDLWRKSAGEVNELSAFVARSWFGDWLGWRISKGGQTPALAVKLRITCADGTERMIDTDGSWSASWNTPFLRAGIWEGETRDGRISFDAFHCAGGTPAVVSTYFRGDVSPCVGASVHLRRDLALEPVALYAYSGAVNAKGTNEFGKVRITRRFAVDESVRLKAGETLVVDFGQNSAAIPEVTAVARAGVEIRIKGAEMLNDGNGERCRGNDGPAGSPYFASYRALAAGGKASVAYVFAGMGEETYLPTFTFMGYRYAAVSVTDDVEIRSIRSIPVSSIARSMERSTIRTGVEDVNRLVSNIRWGMLSNYLSVPTDCPQRDERLGWTADTQVFARSACYVADVYGFLSKWMGDLRDAQGPNGDFPCVAPGDPDRNKFGWSDAGVIVPWTVWRMTGDTRIVDENWEAMVRYMDSLAAIEARCLDEWTFADWLSFEKWESCSATCLSYNDGKGNCKAYPEAKRMWDYLSRCYWCRDAEMMVEMGRATGRDVASFVAMSARARTLLRSAEYFEEDGGLLRYFRDMQTPQLFALALGLHRDEESRKTAVSDLMRNFAAHGNCLQTGFLGTSIIMDVLTSDAGRPDMAYTLLLQHDFPSWLHSVDQGATTIWERWNSYSKKDGFGPVMMNSFNHYAYGAVLGWMYATMAGIQPGPKGGFDDEFRLAPVPDARMGFVEATYRTRRGTIRSSWRYEDGRCRWTFTVPDGARAVVSVGGLEQVCDAGTYEKEIK